mgnify:CR=1 FL=1
MVEGGVMVVVGERWPLGAVPARCRVQQRVGVPTRSYTTDVGAEGGGALGMVLMWRHSITVHDTVDGGGGGGKGTAGMGGLVYGCTGTSAVRFTLSLLVSHVQFTIRRVLESATRIYWMPWCGCWVRGLVVARGGGGCRRCVAMLGVVRGECCVCGCVCGRGGGLYWHI